MDKKTLSVWLPKIKSLEAIDYGVITDEDLGDVGGLSLPDEELAVVRAGHYIFPSTVKVNGKNVR